MYFWYGTPLVAQPPISELTRFTSDNVGILINSVEILQRAKIKEKIKKQGLKKVLQTDAKILMDSGGYLFQKRKNIHIKVSDLINLYETAKPDLAVALDHPLSPSITKSQNYYRRQKTLKNLQIMLEANIDVELMPVVHGYSFNQLINMAKKIKEIYKDCTNTFPKWVGLGSLVPLLKYSKGTKSIPNDSKRTKLKEIGYANSVGYAFAAIALTKRLFPKSNLHVFGIGGTTTMQLVYAAGADSLDSVGWRLKAAHGAIQMIGLSDRFLSPRAKKSRKVLEDSMVNEFLNCKCGVKPHTTEDLDKSFTKRAIHNAYIYLQEFNRIHQSRPITEKKIYEFKQILKTSPLKRYIDLIVKLNNGFFDYMKYKIKNN